MAGLRFEIIAVPQLTRFSSGLTAGGTPPFHIALSAGAGIVAGSDRRPHVHHDSGRRARHYRSGRALGGATEQPCSEPALAGDYAANHHPLGRGADRPHRCPEISPETRTSRHGWQRFYARRQSSLAGLFSAAAGKSSPRVAVFNEGISSANRLASHGRKCPCPLRQRRFEPTLAKNDNVVKAL